MLRWLAVAALAAATISVSARRTAACTCGPATFPVLPLAKNPAPTNSRVWIALPRADVPANIFGVRSTFFIKSTDGKVVAARRRDAGSGDLHWVELIPNAPLAPGADFEVRVERRDGLPPHLLRTFRTGSGPDTQAPELTGAAQAKAVREPRLNTCSTGELHVELILGQDPSAGQPQTDRRSSMVSGAQAAPRSARPRGTIRLSHTSRRTTERSCSGIPMFVG